MFSCGNFLPLPNQKVLIELNQRASFFEYATLVVKGGKPFFHCVVSREEARKEYPHLDGLDDLEYFFPPERGGIFWFFPRSCE